MKKNNFLKTFTKVTCFWIWARNVWQDGQTAFTCPVEQCWKVEPLGQNQSFFVVPTHYMKLFRNFKRKWQGCQVSIHHLQRNILRKNSSEWNSFQIFPMLWLRAKTLGRVVTPASSGSTGIFWKKNVISNYTLFFFNLAEWFPVDLKTAIYVSRRTFPATSFEKSVFCFDSRTLSKNLLRLFPKCFRQFLQKWHPCVQKNKLRRQVFYGKCRLFLSSPDFEQ